MLRREGVQGSFWDSEWIEHLIDREGFEWHFRRVVRPLIGDEDFAWAYSADRGRRAIPPSLVACALILQQRYRMSDREMERQIRFNLATKYALGLPMDDEGFDHTVLCKFRKLLVAGGQEQVCFDRFREALIAAGLIRSGEVMVIDTTHVIADIAVPNTVELLRMGIRGVLEAAGKAHVGVGNQLAKVVELGAAFEAVRRGEEGEHLVELVQGARRLLEYVEKTGDARHPAMAMPVGQLRRILQENTRERGEKEEGGGRAVIEERRGEAVPDRLVSPVDPDARHGRKSAEKKFVGYKAQIVVGAQGFITGIAGMLGNRHDTWGVGEMMSELSGAGVRPSGVVGDKAYADEGLGMDLERDGTRMVTPLKERSERGVFPNDQFELVQEEGCAPRMRCPGGEETAESDVTWRGRFFHFTQCGTCSLKARCTAKAYRTVLASRSFVYRKRKARFNETATYRELMRERAKIERKNGQLKNQLGMKRCRYRGLAKFRLQCFFTALAANIQRWIQMLITAPPSGTVSLGAMA